MNIWIRGDYQLRARTKKLFARLHDDQRGNVIVLYVAAALLLVGMLWAIIGTGARMVQKETIQSSADAAAFSAAVIKAKGLNIIAFCNLLMALLLAIIMILRLIKGALLVALGVCVAACFDIWGGEVLCAFAPTVESLYNTYSNIVAQVEPRIMDAMRGLAKVERAVNKTFPALSLVEAYRVGTNEQYKKNFGKGSLITVTWPLPVGQDMSLPTKDGSWDDLCEEAKKSISRLIEIALSKLGLGPVGSIFGGAVNMLLTPLQGVLCGSGGSSGNNNVTIDTNEKRYSCGDCQNAEKSTWSGTQVVRNPDGSFKEFIPGQTCTMNGFSSLLCNDPNYPGYVTCADGKEMKQVQLVECLKKVKKQENLGNDISDKPKPLLIADDWQQHKDVRAFTLLTDANMSARRQSVNVAVRPGHAGSNPMLNQLLGTAQAEFYAFNGGGHEDLWHMDWRARLVRFTFSNDTDGAGGVGDAAGEGVPAGGAQAVGDKIKDFIMNDGAAALADQFMLH
jgi:hypothetical protein